MINIAICDDEIKVVEKTKQIIENYHNKEINIEIYKSGEELINSNMCFDVIFLDIDMEGINGIDTAKKIREYDKNTKIIYATNYTDYVYSAFSVHAFAYLVKPIKENELHKQLYEALSYMDNENKKSIEFITTDGVERVKINDIFYFEYQSRKVIMKNTNSTYTINEKISVIGKKMEEHGFEMPHKSFCVNLHNVKSIKGYDVYMMDGSIVPLSQKKSSQFREKLNIYLSNHIDNKIRRNI